MVTVTTWPKRLKAQAWGSSDWIGCVRDQSMSTVPVHAAWASNCGRLLAAEQ